MIYLKILQTLSTKKGIIIICYLLYLINERRLTPKKWNHKWIISRRMLLETEEQQKNSFSNNCCVPRNCMFQLKHFRHVSSCHILFLHFLNYDRADCQGLFKITLWMYKFEDVGFMATTYISIFGFVIVVANTIVFFT